MSNIKILSAVLSFLLLFAISCSNEGTTGGDAGNYNYFSVSEESGNSKDITIHNSKVSMAGTVGFTVNGSTSYTISIENVSGSTPCSLEASSFSYNQTSKTLTLSSQGEGEVKNKVSEMKEETPYQYTITFKVVDSSDTSKEKTIDVKVNLYKAKVITKDEIEAMIKSIGEVSVNASYGGSGVAKFDFSDKDKTFQNKSEPNFSVKEKDKKEGTYKISTASNEIVKKLKETEKYKEYFSGCNKKQHEVDGANLTLYFQFTLKSGYALSSEVANLTSEGLSIELTLQNGQTWGE